MRQATFPMCEAPACAFEATSTLDPPLVVPGRAIAMEFVCPIHKRDFLGQSLERGCILRDIRRCFQCGEIGRFRVEDDRDPETMAIAGQPIFRPFACGPACLDIIRDAHLPANMTKFRYARVIPLCDEPMCDADAMVEIREETRGLRGLRRPACHAHRDRVAIDLLRAGLAIRFAKLPHQF